MNKVRMGILGCARICRRGMISGIQNSGLTELVAIASRRPEVATQWAAEFGIPRAIGSYDAMIADPDIDAVYIPLANEEHLHWTLAAAEAGKHVLCEKPLALSVEEAQTIVSGCRRFGVILMEAFMWRHHPRVTAARELVASGRLGKLRMVKMDFSFPMVAEDDWRLDPARGGGALFDIGCYGLNAARLFTGEEPKTIDARAQYHPRGVDMTMTFQLGFPSGVLAQLDCSFEAVYRNRIEVIGSEASLELPGGVLPIGDALLMLNTGDVQEPIAHADVNQYAEQVKAFAQGIAAGKLPAPAEDGLANMTALAAVQKAALANR